LLIHIETDSPNTVIQHINTAVWNRATGDLDVNSRKTACFYCSTGHGYLLYSYEPKESQEMFKCHNFACDAAINPQPEIFNCDLHGPEELINPVP